MAVNATSLSNDRHAPVGFVPVDMFEAADTAPVTEATVHSYARFCLHDVMLRLEVAEGEHVGTVYVLYGKLHELREMRDRIELQRIRWKLRGIFGDARLFVTEHYGSFIAE